MKYSINQSNINEFLNDLNKIRRGIHPSFSGDSVANFEGVIFRFCKDNQETAHRFASELKSSHVESDFHPVRIAQISKMIFKHLTKP